MDTSQALKPYNQHKEASHFLLRQGNQLSCFLVPPHQELKLSKLCFIDHMQDTTAEHVCTPKDGRFHAHLHHGELIEDIFLEACMEEASCGLGPFPWEFPDFRLKVLDDNYQDLQQCKAVKEDQRHVHKAGCGHEQIRHGDHLDWLVPQSDGSLALSHGFGNESASLEHGRLVKIEEPDGKTETKEIRSFDIFKFEVPQTDAWDSKARCPSHNASGYVVAEDSSLKEHVVETMQPLLSALEVNINVGDDVEPARLQRTAIDVHGICCPAEVPLVKKILEPAPGVKEVHVNVAARLVTVQHDAFATPPARLVKLLNSAHLEASIHVTGQWKAANKWPSPYTFASGFFVIVALFYYAYNPLKWVALGAVAVGIPPIMMKSLRALRLCIVDINILMLIAVAGSIALGDYLEAGLIVFLFTFAEWLESRSTDRARSAISSLASLAPQNAILADTGARVPVAQVKVGVRLAVKAGESIPIDGIVVSGRSAVDESSLTGESVPIEKEVGAHVWAGTINMTGYICVETTALAEDSAIARMTRLVEEAQNQRSHVEQLMESFAKYYTPIVIIGALAFVIIPVGVHAHNLRHWLYLALVLLVVACPCALVISTPVTTTCAIAQAARLGLLVKGGKYLEVLGKLKVVAMDKTGTLTEGCFQVVQVLPLDTKANLQDVLFWLSCIESKASHPIASAVVEYARLQGAESSSASINVDEFRILPGEGVSGIVDGHEIAVGNERLATRLHWLEASAAESSCLERWKSQGLTICWVGVDGKPTLIMSAGDQLRLEAGEAVRDMRKLGLRLAMLTGDSLEVANTVQRKLGQIDVHAQLLPEDKVKLLKHLKAAGLTAMVGDGVNDAPALAASDVGIAMGVAGTAIAMETADIALMTNDLRKLAIAIKLGRKARRKIVQNISLSVSTKILVIVLAAVGYASLWGAVLADVGTCLLVIFNSMLLLERTRDRSGCLGFFTFGRKSRSKVCQKGVLLSSDKSREEVEHCCPKKTEGDRDLSCKTSQSNQSCCATKSCCDKKAVNNGMRRRVGNRDPCDKDCQNIDEKNCSAINIVELEGLLSKKTGSSTQVFSDSSQTESVICCSSNCCTGSGISQKEQAVINMIQGGDASSGNFIEGNVPESPYSSRPTTVNSSCASRATTSQCCKITALLDDTPASCLSKTQALQRSQKKLVNGCEHGCCKGQSQEADESAVREPIEKQSEICAPMKSESRVRNNADEDSQVCRQAIISCSVRSGIQSCCTNNATPACCRLASDQPTSSVRFEGLRSKIEESGAVGIMPEGSEKLEPSIYVSGIARNAIKETSPSACSLKDKARTCCTDNAFTGTRSPCCSSKIRAHPSLEIKPTKGCKQGCCNKMSRKDEELAASGPLPDRRKEVGGANNSNVEEIVKKEQGDDSTIERHEQCQQVTLQVSIPCDKQSTIDSSCCMQDACGGIMHGSDSNSKDLSSAYGLGDTTKGHEQLCEGCAGSNCNCVGNTTQTFEIKVSQDADTCGKRDGCCGVGSSDRKEMRLKDASLHCGGEQGLVDASMKTPGQAGGCQGKSCCSATQSVRSI